MVQVKVLVVNVKGLHLSAAADLVKIASAFESDVRLSKDGVEVDAKSIMGLLSLAASMGSEVIVRADGKDEEGAVRAIEALFKAKFNEEA
jgi:phosphocarrier protein HPr